MKGAIILLITMALFMRAQAQFSNIETIFEQTLSTTAAAQIDLQIINKLPGDVVWWFGNSSDLVSIVATISGPTEEDTQWILIDVNFVPTERIRVLVDLNATSPSAVPSVSTPSTDIVRSSPRPRRADQTVSSAAVFTSGLVPRLLVAFGLSLFRRHLSTLIVITLLVVSGSLSTAEVSQVAQVRVDLVINVPRDHYWRSVAIETKDSNISMIAVNTLNKTCAVTDSSAPCPFCCSSNGVCTLNGCACSDGYLGLDCSQGECVPTNCANGSCPVIDSACGCSSLGVCALGQVKCQNNVLRCLGAIFPPSSVDSCGEDSNCDGQLSNQPDFATDPAHCGSCANRCSDRDVHALWACENSTCVFAGCKAGFYDLTGTNNCSYACQYLSPYEQCNGVDDNCDGQIDEGAVPTDIKSHCGISRAASTAECTTQVTAQCVNGAWKCSFPAKVCEPTCAAAVELCDALDNNCNGVLNENVPQYGLPCASDDFAAVPHGACRTQGTYVCNGEANVTCSATKAACGSLPNGCTELCDGIDNDCDGLIDETFAQKGSAAAFFVQPTVTRLGAALWMSSYEVSRVSSTATTTGTGNGWTSASGDTIDAVKGCSAGTRLPWTQISPLEAANVCSAMGGRLCTLSEWRTACYSSVTCVWGYSPVGSACSLQATSTKFCNVAGYDIDSATSGDQFAMLPTATLAAKNCGADWSRNNTGSASNIWDITGNVFEIVSNGANYAMVGGSFRTAEIGSRCATATTIASTQRTADTGFRCCFDSDPTL